MTPDAKVTAGLVEEIRPLLGGYHPATQGSALADLLAIWLAGHPPEYRKLLLKMHIEMVRELIPENARIMGTGV